MELQRVRPTGGLEFLVEKEFLSMSGIETRLFFHQVCDNQLPTSDSCSFTDCKVGIFKLKEHS